MFRLYKLETEKRSKSNLETIYDYLDLYNGHPGYMLLTEVKTEQEFNSIVINYIEKWKHRKKSNTFIALASILFMFSFTFVFEARNLPEYDQNGDDIFYLEKDNSYYLKNGKCYDLYLNGEYFFTTEDLAQVPNDFKDLPIYEKGDFKWKKEYLFV